MRRLIATEFMSLDGVIDSPGGDNDFVRGGWTFAVALWQFFDVAIIDGIVNGVGLLTQSVSRGLRTVQTNLLDPAQLASTLRALVAASRATDRLWLRRLTLGNTSEDAAASGGASSSTSGPA